MQNKNGLKRVVITGAGVVCPAGNSLESCWTAFASGRSAMRRITRFDLTPFPVTVAGEIDDQLFAGMKGYDAKTDRALTIATFAARNALQDAKLESEGEEPKQIATILGSGIGPSEALETAYVGFAAKGWRGLAPSTVPRSMSNAISAHVSIDFKLTGPQASISSACSSANMAMTRAVDLIRLGREHTVLCGGFEAPICPSIFSSWAAMRVMANSTDPQQCLLPFHAKRGGFSLAEGGALFIFEELEQAQKRGAKIYAEVLGYGESNDAMHITRPNEVNQTRAIAKALNDAGIQPSDVDYIGAHGTGTIANDLCETNSIKGAFGDAVRSVPISSIKSVIGHTLGACGALSAVSVLGAFAHQMVPPTANLTEIDPKCDLDYVPCEARSAKVDTAIINSFAFGGANSVLVFRRWQ